MRSTHVALSHPGVERRYGMPLVSRLDKQQAWALRRKKLEVELSSLLASDERDAKFEVDQGVPAILSRAAAQYEPGARRHGSIARQTRILRRVEWSKLLGSSLGLAPRQRGRKLVNRR